MDVNGLSSTLSTSASLLTRGSAASIDSPGSDRVPDREQNDHCRAGCRRGRALGIFRQEMRFALKMQFHARFAASQTNYLQAAEPAATADVAAETLGVAKQAIAEAPTRAGKSIAALKASVQHAATIARQTVDQADDVADLDAAVARVDDSLNDMDREAAVNRESSASVLNVDTRTKQRSSIRIRTQEGDIVRLDLKRVDSMSASDVAVSNENGNATSTEVEISSRSRMILRVKGDLNDNELAAITSVFEQAESIANEFFGGDIGAAFNLSQGFEFDAEQLARVNLRFRMRQVTNVSYAEAVQRPAIEAAEPPVVAPQPVISMPSPVQPVETPAAATPAEDVPAVETPAEPAPDTAAPLADTSALAGFFDLVSTFLRSIGDGFGDGSGGSFRLHYSESFKLELLRTVIHASAPAESDNAVANADGIINAVVDALPEADD